MSSKIGWANHAMRVADTLWTGTVNSWIPRVIKTTPGPGFINDLSAGNDGTYRETATYPQFFYALKGRFTVKTVVTVTWLEVGSRLYSIAMRRDSSGAMSPFALRCIGR
ncbi:unnamed protein product [Heligmosomoides polygyrus]|uniref:NIDO domain-containing protein n=1 Tax=Heligmosomoides polygyrus TaxID=6339 RepID=A0A183FFI9_HELPZ|nr:unnamed protein product [Heligmosomoides polygyrus]